MHEKIIENAVAFITELFQNDFSGHGADHTLRVYKTALQIAAEEPPCDLVTVSLAALLHDTDDHKLFQTENNANARRFLEQNGVDQARTCRILQAVNAVSFSQNAGRRPETPEGRIVQDADRLDAVGAVGIARTFAYGGSHGRPLEDSIGHFSDKLLLLADTMNTDSARRMARERHAFLELFLEHWRSETELFYDTSDLSDGEIVLKLARTCGPDPARRWLPAYYFDICRTDGTAVGTCDLRIGHNEKTYIGGNIGYGVKEPYRGHRYAARACVLLFRQAKKHGLDHLYITCDPANAASARTCELAGGEYVETADIPPDNEMYAEGKRRVRIYRFEIR